MKVLIGKLIEIKLHKNCTQNNFASMLENPIQCNLIASGLSLTDRPVKIKYSTLYGPNSFLRRFSGHNLR